MIATSILFRGLQPDAVLDIALAGKVKRVAKGSTVFEQGAPADRLFVLLQGRVKAIQSTPDGQQVTARFLNPGDPFGCVVLMAAGTYPVTALAEVDSLVAGWNAALMVRFADQYPKIAMNALQYVGAQLRDTQSRLQEAITERIEQRIAHALLRLIGQSGRKTAEGIEINFPISRQDIAEITGSRLFTVSRTLSKWQFEGDHQKRSASHNGRCATSASDDRREVLKRPCITRRPRTAYANCWQVAVAAETWSAR